MFVNTYPQFGFNQRLPLQQREVNRRSTQFSSLERVKPAILNLGVKTTDKSGDIEFADIKGLTIRFTTYEPAVDLHDAWNDLLGLWENSQYGQDGYYSPNADDMKCDESSIVKSAPKQDSDGDTYYVVEVKADIKTSRKL